MDAEAGAVGEEEDVAVGGAEAVAREVSEAATLWVSEAEMAPLQCLQLEVECLCLSIHRLVVAIHVYEEIDAMVGLDGPVCRHKLVVHQKN